MRCWWHHWHPRGSRHLITLRPAGRCRRPQEAVACRQQCCRCEALRWKGEAYGAVLIPGYADAQVLAVGEACDAYGWALR